jgi:hypothetical protein
MNQLLRKLLHFIHFITGSHYTGTKLHFTSYCPRENGLYSLVMKKYHKTSIDVFKILFFSNIFPNAVYPYLYVGIGLIHTTDELWPQVRNTSIGPPISFSNASIACIDWPQPMTLCWVNTNMLLIVF